MLILNIFDILKKHSDVEHRLSVKEIGERLEDEYSQKVDRKAIKRNLMNLLEFGYDIEYSETIRINKWGEEESIYSDWYLNQEFTDAELRMLIDGLLFSKHIPYKQCKGLVEKLEGLSNNYFKAKVKHVRNMPENQPENKELFYTIEILDEAISKRKKVTFQYNDYGIDKKRHPRTDKDGTVKKYKVSPYQMAATNGRYYLICNSDTYLDSSNFRIDRISNIQITGEPVKPMKEVTDLKEGLNLPKIMAEHIYMFTGKSVRVKFKASKSIVGDILDWFGQDVKFAEEAESQVMVTVNVDKQAMFFWALQYGQYVEVVSPVDLREWIGKTVQEMAKKYE